MMDFKRLVEFVGINISFIYKKYFKISVPVKLEKKKKFIKKFRYNFSFPFEKFSMCYLRRWKEIGNESSRVV